MNDGHFAFYSTSLIVIAPYKYPLNNNKKCQGYLKLNLFLLK